MPSDPQWDIVLLTNRDRSDMLSQATVLLAHIANIGPVPLYVNFMSFVPFMSRPALCRPLGFRTASKQQGRSQQARSIHGLIPHGRDSGGSRSATAIRPTTWPSSTTSADSVSARIRGAG